MNNTEKRLEFWKMLEANQFVKSTNSITDQVEEYPPAIQVMEATVRINGEFDKYAIDEWLTTSIHQAIAEERERIERKIKQAWNYPCNCDRKNILCIHDFSQMKVALSSLDKPLSTD